MSSTLRAPYADLGEGGDYYIEANYGIRIYDDRGEKIPGEGQVGASLKGGLRTNYLGDVPILDGKKDRVGMAQILMVISAKPENMDLEHLLACGFASIKDAVDYVEKNHGEEYERDGVFTIYYYLVKSRD